MSSHRLVARSEQMPEHGGRIEGGSPLAGHHGLPSLLVREAVQKMRTHQLGCVFVVDAAGKPVGMFHERLLIQLLDECPRALDESVARHVEKRCTCVRADEAVGSLLYQIDAQDKRFVGVVDEEGKGRRTVFAADVIHLRSLPG